MPPLDGERFTVEIDAPDDVTTEVIIGDNPIKGSSGYLPNDRISARAYAAADQTLVVRIGKEALVAKPTFVTVTGTGNDVASLGSRGDHRRAVQQGHRRAAVQGLGHLRRQHRDHRR